MEQGFLAIDTIALDWHRNTDTEMNPYSKICSISSGLSTVGIAINPAIQKTKNRNVTASNAEINEPLHNSLYLTASMWNTLTIPYVFSSPLINLCCKSDLCLSILHMPNNLKCGVLGGGCFVTKLGYWCSVCGFAMLPCLSFYCFLFSFSFSGTVPLVIENT